MQNCETCVKGIKEECLNCAGGFYKAGWGECKVCDVGNCAECGGEKSCVSCVDGYEMVTSNETKEVACIKKACPNNMLLINTTCTCPTTTY